LVPPAGAVHRLQPDFLVRLGEEVWRLTRRADRAAAQVGEDALRGVHDSAARLAAALTENGVQIEDHTGAQYQEGMRLTVLHVDGKVEDDELLWVAETVRPTVLLLGQVQSEGQVILTTRPPEKETPT